MAKQSGRTQGNADGHPERTNTNRQIIGDKNCCDVNINWPEDEEEVGNLTTQLRTKELEKDHLKEQLDISTADFMRGLMVKEKEIQKLQSVIERLSSDSCTLPQVHKGNIHQYIQTTDQLKHQNQQLLLEVDRLSTQICNLQQAYRAKEQEHMRTVDQLQHQLTISFQNMERAIKGKENDIQSLQIEVDRLTTQLGHGMNQRLAENETALEHINKSNRPTRIMDEYIELMSNQWLEAKDKMDELYPEDCQEELKLKLLCDILIEAEALAYHEMRTYKMFIQQSLQDPITALSQLWPEGHANTPVATDDEKCRSLTTVPKNELSAITYPQSEQRKCYGDFEDFDERVLGRDLKNLLSALIKDNSNNPNSERLAQVLLHKLQTTEGYWKNILTTNGCQQSLMDYIKCACVVCWKMAAQRPPMTFDFGGIGCPPSKDKHEFYYNCSKAKDAVISSYVSPALMHKEKLLVKGKVYTQTKAHADQLIIKYE